MHLALDFFGQLNLAVNAAGAAAVRPLADTEEASFDQVLATNVKTAFLAMKFEIPSMRTGGAIVNVSSRAGLVGIPTGSIYSASKHAVSGWTKSAYPSNPTRHCKVGHNASAALLGAWIQLAN